MAARNRSDINNGGSDNNNFYEAKSFPTIEQAKLAEPLTFEEIKDIDGKFFLKVMAPEEDTSSPRTRVVDGYSQSNFVTLKIPAYMLLSFTESKYQSIESTIKHSPELACPDAEVQKHKSTDYEYYMAAPSNSFTIPKDTTFIVAFVGGDARMDKAVIIGVRPE